MDDPNEAAYNNYIANRNNYDELESSQQESLDKHMLALSSASLAFSIAFIEKVVPFQQASYLFILIVGWLSFGFAIFCTISSFYASVLTCRDYRQQMDDNYSNGISGGFPLVSKWETKIDWCNKGAYFAFIIGLVCLLFFSVVNVVKINRESQIMEEKKQIIRVEEGKVPAQLPPVMTPTTGKVSPQPTKPHPSGGQKPVYPLGNNKKE